MERAVVDTNVVFEGVTRRDSASGLLVETWLAELFRPHVSNAVAYEYADVLSRKLSPQRWKEVEPLLHGLLDLAELTEIHYSWRPTSPDPADEAIVDCAMNAAAIVVTHNLRDFRSAQETLGLPVMTPAEFLTRLAEGQADKERR